jgi:dTDP-4-amino-4,6-dideoxygalactose transaminase
MTVMAVLAVNGGDKVRTEAWPSWPIWDQCEIDAVTEVIESGQWGRLAETSKCQDFEEKFAAYQDAAYGVAVTNGTAALEVALQAAGVDVGDEVILCPYTFVASATSILTRKAVPVFVDCDLETRNIDTDAIEPAITPRTKAIMPVHFSGRACDMQRINDIAARHDLMVVEDAAHCWGAMWNDRKLGAVGDIGGVSFQASKHITAGEGGIVLTNDEDLAAKAFSYHHIGRIPGRPFYEHHNCGSNYRMNEVTAAILLCQLERLDEQTETRHQNGLYLDDRLGRIDGLEPLRRDPYMTRIARHAFCVRYDEDTVGVSREKFMAAVSAEGVGCGGGYPHPLYKNPLFTDKRFGRITEMVEYPDYADMYLPNCEKICDTAIWLSQTMLLATRADMDDIVNAFQKVAENVEELR